MGEREKNSSRLPIANLLLFTVPYSAKIFVKKNSGGLAFLIDFYSLAGGTQKEHRSARAERVAYERLEHTQWEKESHIFHASASLPCAKYFRANRLTLSIHRKYLLGKKYPCMIQQSTESIANQTLCNILLWSKILKISMLHAQNATAVGN